MRQTKKAAQRSNTAACSDLVLSSAVSFPTGQLLMVLVNLQEHFFRRLNLVPLSHFDQSAVNNVINILKTHFAERSQVFPKTFEMPINH